MEAARILKDKINSTAITTGVLATGHFWPGLVEIAMRSELDYMIIDLEHLEHDAEAVATACSIGRLANFPVLIRPAAAEFTRMRLALDLGACGLLVPYVESLTTMQEVQEAVYLKPRGRRRPGGPGNAWVKDYHYETWRTTVEDDLIILPQIESRAGLDEVENIAAHPLTTAIAVGPYDLSADLGVCWDPTRPELQDALARIRTAGKAAGKNMWMIGDGAALVQAGYTFLCLGETTMALQSKLGEINSAAKA
ncbi:MAG: hypothetical protein KA250_18470 [Verrucomicrobiales bacterium]|nr:hypothetical protein [Verrucomicrobiales bacterium]